MLHYLSLLIAILIGVVGQIFLKQAAIANARTEGFNLLYYLSNIPLWLGLFCYGLSTIFYLLSLQKIPLSLAYPSLAIGYVLVIFIAKFYFKETLNFHQVLGVVLIILGVSLLFKK